MARGFHRPHRLIFFDLLTLFDIHSDLVLLTGLGMYTAALSSRQTNLFYEAALQG